MKQLSKALFLTVLLLSLLNNQSTIKGMNSIETSEQTARAQLEQDYQDTLGTLMDAFTKDKHPNFQLVADHNPYDTSVQKIWELTIGQHLPAQQKVIRPLSPETRERLLREVFNEGIRLLFINLADLLRTQQGETPKEREERVSRVIDNAENAAVDENEVCTICMEQADATPTWHWVKLSCGHAFHKKCLTNWLREKNNCPKCRATPQQEEEAN